MPPAPSGETISYGPNFVPEVSAIAASIIHTRGISFSQCQRLNAGFVAQTSGIGLSPNALMFTDSIPLAWYVRLSGPSKLSSFSLPRKASSFVDFLRGHNLRLPQHGGARCSHWTDRFPLPHC